MSSTLTLTPMETFQKDDLTSQTNLDAPSSQLEAKLPIFLWRDEDSQLLHSVQMARIFPDSKTFVDMKLRYPRERVQESFEILEDRSPENLRAFVNENFEHENTTLREHSPEDWDPSEPAEVLESLKEYPEYQKFISDINSRWKSLCRKTDEEVRENQEFYSLIYLPNPVVIPGGRFTEIYYWDSYWIIRGLLVCNMTSTAKGILENFLHLINLFGHIPNGGRTYYVSRSQPPLFIPMVKEYVDKTQDFEFVRKNIGSLRVEFDYWVKHHSVDVEDSQGKARTLFRYKGEELGPRPESYFEDYEIVKSLHLNSEKEDELYRQFKTAAESGWDFSSRWFVGDDGKNEGDLKDTKADKILPVDLNTYLCYNAEILSEFYGTIIGDENSAVALRKTSEEILTSIDQILWNPTRGVWLDYDMYNSKTRDYFYPSNLAPLLLISPQTAPILSQEKIDSAVRYLEVADDRTAYTGGLPISLTKTGQQWDYPNSWCPLEHFVVQGLLKAGTIKAQEMALFLAKRRVQGAFHSFKADAGNIYEKYDATDSKLAGHGGEYQVQLGFGWTNGVILDFFDIFREKLLEE